MVGQKRGKREGGCQDARIVLLRKKKLRGRSLVTGDLARAISSDVPCILGGLQVEVVESRLSSWSDGPLPPLAPFLALLGGCYSCHRFWCTLLLGMDEFGRGGVGKKNRPASVRKCMLSRYVLPQCKGMC